MIAEPGIYQMTDAEYLADPVVDPSLNNSTAKVLLELSPAHAFAMHPRLGAAPDVSGDSSEAQDVGHVAHQMFLHGESAVRIINVTDFRTNAAKRLRDEAINEGRIPLKAERYDAVRRVVDALEQFRIKTGAFTEGKPEQTLVWREGPQWSRAKIDWLPDEPSAALWDLKTTSGRAVSQGWTRSAYDFGYDMQAIHYARGAECVREEPPDGMLFAVIETKAPYGIRVFQFSPQAIEIAEAKCSTARDLWARCREAGEWPSYSVEPQWIDAPFWVLREWEASTRTGATFAERRKAAEERQLATVDRMERAGNFGG
jgi:hypothetical protein